ncbi:hypothetical protein [Bifidobacterium choloepi]|uniref:Uncharacterized protein n=1 Tax=Bifidobacterium choloepi TaxID=2614131 RepID=A0A6I5NJS8_9BIFI|nr:hypothetical protein [Bifidobacterium choloepi]NEG69122.1 hypothetical protein [Bifidobacterium choloepi]
MKNVKKKWFIVVAVVLVVIALALKIAGFSPWVCAPLILVAAIVGVIGIFREEPEEKEQPGM